MQCNTEESPFSPNTFLRLESEYIVKYCKSQCFQVHLISRAVSQALFWVDNLFGFVLIVGRTIEINFN